MSECCDDCDKPVFNGCLECEVYLCKKHFDAHMRAVHKEKVESARVKSDEIGPAPAPAKKRDSKPEPKAAPNPDATHGRRYPVGTCLICKLERSIFTRGLCTACASTVSKLVKAGTTTRDELVAAGLMLVQKRHPRGFDAETLIVAKLDAFRKGTK